jgi:hypothetical protein
MCQELIHRCKYCNKDYICTDSDLLCPTINYDKDKNLCPSCRRDLEVALREEEIREFEEFEEKVKVDDE